MFNTKRDAPYGFRSIFNAVSDTFEWTNTGGGLRLPLIKLILLTI